MLFPKKAFIILLFLANLTPTNTMEIENWRLKAAQRRTKILVNHINTDNNFRGEIMNNTTHSAFYAFLVGAAIATGTVGAMEPRPTQDLTRSTLFESPKQDITVPTTQQLQGPIKINTPLEQELVELADLKNQIKENKFSILQSLSKIHNKLTDDPAEKTILCDLAKCVNANAITDSYKVQKLTEYIQSKQNNQQPALKITIVDNYDKNTTQKYKEKYKLNQLEQSFECFLNKLSILKKDTPNTQVVQELLSTIEEIRLLLPSTITLRLEIINKIIALLKTDNISEDSSKKCSNLISEIIKLSIDPASDKILDNSIIQKKHLEERGDIFPSSRNIKKIISYILNNKNLPDSFRIYMLQLMWWKEVSTPENPLKKIKSTAAKAIRDALKKMACQKNNTGNVDFLKDDYDRNKPNGLKYYNNDHYCEGSEHYSTATLPSITHNAGSAPTPNFHDAENNALLLDEFIKQENLDGNFRKLLASLARVRDRKTPDYDNIQPYRRPESEINPLQSLIDQNKHFPLTEESLDNQHLPENFRLLLEKYLKQNDQTKKEQAHSDTEQRITHLHEKINGDELSCSTIFSNHNQPTQNTINIEPKSSQESNNPVNDDNNDILHQLSQGIITKPSNTTSIITHPQFIDDTVINAATKEVEDVRKELNAIASTLSILQSQEAGNIGYDNSHYNSEEDIKKQLTQKSPNQCRPSTNITEDDTITTNNTHQDTVIIESDDEDNGASVGLPIPNSTESSSSSSDSEKDTDTNQAVINIPLAPEDEQVDSIPANNQPKADATTKSSNIWTYITNTITSSIESVWNSLWNILGWLKFW